jgi:hypothetical protein
MSNGHIFISYRRDDSAGYTRAVYDQLAKRFTKERIFMDVDAIEPGLPFDEVINQAVGRCEILLAMIGKRWMEQQPGVGPRINDEKDFVRLEIAAALSRNVRVIPVLLDGAGMPTEELLPEPLRALARRNAIEISNSRFNSDVDRLVEAVSKVLGESNVPHSQEGSRSHRTMQYWLVGAFTAVALFSSIAYFYSPTKNGSQTANGQPDSTTPKQVKLNPLSATSQPTTGTVSDLCKELEDKSIDLDANNYRGVVGPAGTKVIETGHGTFRFETEVVFSGEDAKQEFGGILRDPIVGVCQDNLITLDRKLRDGSIQRYTGKLFKADTGRTEMEGRFESGKRLVKWSGRIVNPSK